MSGLIRPNKALTARLRPLWYQRDMLEAPTRHRTALVHRRGGKTVTAVFDCLRHLVQWPLPMPRVAYIAPFQNQAVRISWSYLTSLAHKRPDLFKVNKSNYTIECIPNGGQLMVLGADKADALRGMYLDFACLDELADMAMNLIEEVIRPCLADREGRLLGIGTARGMVNSLYELHTLDSPEWSHFTYTVDDTGILKPSEVENLRREMSSNRFAQEFMCDFGAMREGVIYQNEIGSMVRDGRYMPLGGVDPDLETWAVFDLGYADKTACGIMQKVGNREYRMVAGKEWQFTDFLSILDEVCQSYPVDRWIGPHDLRQHEFTTGTTRWEAAAERGILFDMAPKVSIEDGIEAVRMFLPKLYLCSEEATDVYKALSNYQYAWDGVKRVYSVKPLHNWASHMADMVRYMALMVDEGAWSLPLEARPVQQQQLGYRRAG